MNISFFGVIVPCVIMATCFYLLFTYEEPKDAQQTAPVKQTVTKVSDYPMKRLKVINDYERHIVCFFDTDRDRFISCANI